MTDSIWQAVFGRQYLADGIHRRQATEQRPHKTDDWKQATELGSSASGVNSVQRSIIFVLAGLFVLLLLAVTLTYSVRFTEAAVLTTFGRASEEATVLEPGLKFKAPYPIQSVTTYDTRARLLETRLEAMQTADERQIIVESFLVWRVAQPLKFFERFSNAGRRSEDHFERATSTLNTLLRSAMAETGRFELSKLFTPDIGSSQIPALEAAILEALNRSGEQGQSLSDYGIEALQVGISRILLGEETTGAINDRMAATRDRLAKELEDQGAAAAVAIRTKAQSDAERIMSFARLRAEEIRQEGVIEASQFTRQMNEMPSLAAFLRGIEFMKQTYGQRITLVLPADSPGLSLLQLDKLQQGVLGEIPDLGLGGNNLLPQSLIPQNLLPVEGLTTGMVVGNEAQEDRR
jgi:modulator of FtsH protease HflC